MTSIDKLHLMRPNSVSNTGRVQVIHSTGTDPGRQSFAAGGNKLPPAIPGLMKTAEKEEIEKAVSNVTGYVQNISRELSFTVDAELEKTVITVIDEETGDVVRQIPTEDILELAKNIAAMKEDSNTGILFQGDA